MSTTFHTPINNISTTVGTAYTHGSGSLVLATGTGAQFGSSFPLIITASRAGSVLSILNVTGRSTDTLTISGAIEGKTDVDLLVNDTIEMRPTAMAITELQSAINTNAAAAVHLAGTETVTGDKTFTGTTTLGALVLTDTAGSGANPVLFGVSGFGSGFPQVVAYPNTGSQCATVFSVVPRGHPQPTNGFVNAELIVFNNDVVASPSDQEFSGFRATDGLFILGTGKAGTRSNLPLMLAAGWFTDSTTNANQIYLDTNGRVGIGKSSPSVALDVNGSIAASNLSGTNTGDQTITLSGDATGSGTAGIAVTLASSGVTAGTYTNANITVDAKGRITAASSASSGGSAPTFTAGSGAGTGATTTGSTGTDTGGLIVLNTGTSPSASATAVTVTFSAAFSTAPLTVLLSPANSAAAALSGTSMIYADTANVSTTQFVVSTGSTALTASTTYKWYYRVG